MRRRVPVGRVDARARLQQRVNSRPVPANDSQLQRRPAERVARVRECRCGTGWSGGRREQSVEGALVVLLNRFQEECRVRLLFTDEIISICRLLFLLF